MDEVVVCSWCGTTAPPRDYNILGEPLPPHDWGDDWSKDPPRLWCSAQCAYEDVSRDEYKNLKARDLTKIKPEQVLGEESASQDVEALKETTGEVMTITFDSTSIRGAEYDEMMRTLTIYFQSGGVYDFLEVPKTVFQEFANAESAGKFFHQHIRDEYDSMKRQ